MKQLILILALCIALPSLLFAGSGEDQMRADVKKLVDAAKKCKRGVPWESSPTEINKVADYGKVVAPLLLELLCDKPEEDINCDLCFQQYAALALCKIYNVQCLAGQIYLNRARMEDNNKVKAFWTEMIINKK